jgi:hypothetical protein
LVQLDLTHFSFLNYFLKPETTQHTTPNNSHKKQITRSISAHEQHPIGGWFKTFPKKVIDRAPAYIIWLGGSLSLAYGSIATAQALTDAEDFSHRP